MPTTITDVETASAVLLTNHTGQHRCDDGVYYGVHDWQTCPTQTAHTVLTSTIDQLRAAPHTAAHTPEAVDAVAVGMTGFDLTVLAEEDREGWRLTARYAIEALSAWLDEAGNLPAAVAAAMSVPCPHPGCGAGVDEPCRHLDGVES